MGKGLNINVLLVEDDQFMANLIKYNLSNLDYNVALARDGVEGMEIAQNDNPDIIILDCMIPHKSGIEVCTELRAHEKTQSIPIIMISALDDNNKILGLEKGADDYVIKPFSIEELVARIGALLRRTKPSFTAKTLSFHDIEMDLTSYEVKRRREKVKLSRIEFRILQVFLENPETLLGRAVLIDKVWGLRNNVDLRTIDVHVTRLRKALSDASSDGTSLISTVWGKGYKLSADSD